MEKSTDHETQLSEVYEKLESGDISVLEGIKQANALTAEMTTSQAVDAAGKRTQEVFFNKDVQTAQGKFLRDHPDFNEVISSGVLQPYIDKNPIVDKTIAYFQWKADQGFKRKEESKTLASFKEDKTEQPLSDDDLLNHQLRTIEKMKDSRPARRAALSEEEIENQQMDTLKKMRGE